MLFSTTLLSHIPNTTESQDLIKQAQTLVHQHNYPDALQCYKNYVQQHPKEETGLFGMASCLFKLNRYKEALQIYQLITALSPTSCGAWYNTAYCARLLGDHTTAINAYKKTLSLKPQHENAHFGLSKSYLALGDYEKGWEEFEWRYGDVHLFKQSKIDLSKLTGKKVLLRSEWGFGDVIQFIRYAKILKDIGATVYLESIPALIPLLKSCPFIDQLIPMGNKLPLTDVNIPLLSMPYLCGTRLETIPAPLPYLFADRDLISYWKNKLAHDPKIKIGICWHAKPIFLEDHIYTRRSIPLEMFVPLSRIPGIQLYSLQKVHGQEELINLPSDVAIYDFGSELDTIHGCFMDTAAIMKHLDLVISVDTAIVHLAGALGVPTWILLPYTAEWRWLQERTDSPWYPNIARLFRQKTPGEWSEVLDAVYEALSSFIKQKGIL